MADSVVKAICHTAAYIIVTILGNSDGCYHLERTREAP